MVTIDLHSDTICALWKSSSSEGIDKNSLMVDARKMEWGGVTAECFALFTPMHSSADGCGERIASLTPYGRLTELHERFSSEIENSKLIKQAKSVGDIENGQGLKAILTIEDLGPTGGDLGKVSLLKDWGVMISGITWNWENEYGYPNSKDRDVMSKGLKGKGFEALEIFKESGIAVDVSHLSDGGFWDVLDSGCRALATHSNCRALVNHPRNLTDEMMKALADKGGVSGLNLCPEFLSEDGKGESRVDDMVRHIKHMIRVGGEDFPALGSDFDGIGGTKFEIPDASGWPKLFDALKKEGVSERQIEKIRGLNALRALRC